MPVLDAQLVTKTLGTRTLLSGANVTIARGEKLGVVGDNGAGKSTLARILAGVMEPDTGELHRRRGTSVAYLEQDPSLDGDQTAVDVALSGLDAWNAAKGDYDAICAKLAEPSAADEMPALLAKQEEAASSIELLGGWNRPDDAARILRMLGITDHAQTIATMSGGERRRVALARLLVAEPDLAVLDEPTNHLDADTIEWLEDYLADSYRGAVVLITHDRWLLNRVVSRTLEVEEGQVHSYQGGWEAYLMGRNERRQREERAEANRQNFLRREIEWLRRQPKARTGKQKARIDRATSAMKVEAPKRLSELEFDMAEERLGSTILEARDLSVAIGGKPLLSGLTFHLTKGARLGILGKSGAGKTTLLRTLLGEIPPAAGEVVRGKNTRVAYLDQMRGDLDDDETVYDMITGGRPSVTVGEQTFTSYSYLERFRFRGEAVRQKVGGLSGGERARVALARLLLSPANVLVLDEPTNDLDVMTLGALEELILGLAGSTIVVSHDRYFLDRIATSVLALDGEGHATHIHGGYSSYAEWRQLRSREKRAQREAEEALQAGVNASEESRPDDITQNAPTKKKLTYGERLELEGLMMKIETSTAEVERLESELADPTLYAERHDQAPALEKSLTLAKQALEELEMRWLELEERNA